MSKADNRHPPPKRGRRKKRKPRKSENRTSLRQRGLIALQIGSVLITIIKTLINW